MAERFKKTAEMRLMVSQDRKAAIVQTTKDMGFATTTDFFNAAIDEMTKGSK